MCRGSPPRLKKPRLVPRFCPLEIWDLHAMECWLAAMAAKGLHYRRHNLFFHLFEQGAPKTVRYRLEAVSPLSPTPDAPRAALGAALGWRFVDSLGQFSVYVCDDPAAAELHTDPVTESYTMDTLAKKVRMLAATLLVPLALLVLCLLPLRSIRTPFLLQMVEGSMLFLPFSIAVEVVLVLGMVARLGYFLRLRRRLRAGLPAVRRGGYRGKAAANLLFLALVSLFAAVSLWSSVRSVSGSSAWSITPETPSPLSFSLADIERDPGFQYGNSPIRDRDMDNYAHAEWSLLAPEQYEITQRGEIPDRLWADSGRTYSPSVTISPSLLIGTVYKGKSSAHGYAIVSNQLLFDRKQRRFHFGPSWPEAPALLVLETETDLPYSFYVVGACQFFS